MVQCCIGGRIYVPANTTKIVANLLKAFDLDRRGFGRLALAPATKGVVSSWVGSNDGLFAADILGGE